MSSQCTIVVFSVIEVYEKEGRNQESLDKNYMYNNAWLIALHVSYRQQILIVF